MRRALAHFPLRDVARRILDRYFVPGGKARGRAVQGQPGDDPGLVPPRTGSRCRGQLRRGLPRARGSRPSRWASTTSRRSSSRPCRRSSARCSPASASCSWAPASRRPSPASSTTWRPARSAELRVDVKDARPDEVVPHALRSGAYCGGAAPRLERPRFLAIIASAPLARMMAKKASGRVDGFVVEGPTAGGHNAPPRGGAQLGDDERARLRRSATPPTSTPSPRSASPSGSPDPTVVRVASCRRSSWAPRASRSAPPSRGARSPGSRPRPRRACWR